jgi:hypothetical protein
MIATKSPRRDRVRELQKLCLRSLPTAPRNGCARNGRDLQINLDIFLLKDESLEDSANLPAPDVIAAEIANDLKKAKS